MKILAIIGLVILVVIILGLSILLASALESICPYCGGDCDLRLTDNTYVCRKCGKTHMRMDNF